METSEPSIIDRQYVSGNATVVYLTSQKEITLSSDAENNFKKNLLLSIASYFEKLIIDTLCDFAKSHSNEDDLIVSFIKVNGVSRKYHTLFEWERTNANSFFSNFGEDFKKRMIKLVNEDKKLDESIKAFLEIGRERNKLVHQNYAELQVDKTADEIYTLYKKSLYFITKVRAGLVCEEKKTKILLSYPKSYFNGLSRNYG